METVYTSHPLRKIILRYDRQVLAPAFETLALQYYMEVHDRVHEIRQRLTKAREQVPGFNFQIEELEDQFRYAQYKFDHLKVMIPTNPNKDVVREQLESALTAMSALMDDFLVPMIEEANAFFAYDDYIFEQEEWMDKVAFPAFSKIFSHHTECAVDIVYFDRDLEDFKYVLGDVKKMEGRYIDEMNDLVDKYSDLNDEIDVFYEQLEEFDEALLKFF